MTCPLDADGVHRLNGRTCPCGFVLHVGRFGVSFDVTEGTTLLVSDAFNCDSLDEAIDALRKAVEELEKRT